MRKFATTLLALLLLAHANATSYVTVDNIHYCIDETAQTATVVCRQYSEETNPENSWMHYSADELYVGDITIPASFAYDGATYAVTASGAYAFAGSKQMTSLALPASLVTFGNGTFTWCNALKSITVDENNPKFKSQNGIMYYRSPLAIFFVPALFEGDITLPDGLTEIPSSAFQRHTKITSVSVPNSVTAIRDGAFDNCSSLVEINFPSKLTTIERNAFSSCTQLAMVDLSATQVENVGYAAFDGCTNLAWLYLGKHLKTIGKYAFENAALYALELPATLQTIDDYAFRGCTGLATVVNNSSLDIRKGAETHGMVAYYATEVIDNRTPTALAETATTRPSIAAQGRTLQISNANGAALTIYNTSGMVVCNEKQAKNQTFELPNAGIYLVKIGNHTERIAVK